MRRTAAGLCALLLSVGVAPTGVLPAHASGLVWPVGPSPSTDAPAQPCASLLFVGVRGSGEPVPYGDTVTRVRNNLRAATRDASGTVREVWVDYPAANPHTLAQLGLDELLLGGGLLASPYFSSVRAGASAVAAVLADSAARCPRERVVVAGFSQGAEVATMGVAGADVSRLAGVVVAGNPANAPTLPGSRLGSARPRALGLTSSLFYLRGAVASDETKGDPVAAALTAVLALRSRTPSAALLTTAAEAEGTRVDPALGEGWQSACLAGDLTCDAGEALARVLSTQTTMTQEIDASRVVHLSYNEQVLAPATDAVARRVVAMVEPPAPAQPQPPAVPSGAVWRQPAPWALLGVFLTGLGLGLVVRGQRRD